MVQNGLVAYALCQHWKCAGAVPGDQCVPSRHRSSSPSWTDGAHEVEQRTTPLRLPSPTSRSAATSRVVSALITRPTGRCTTTRSRARHHVVTDTRRRHHLQATTSSLAADADRRTDRDIRARRPHADGRAIDESPPVRSICGATEMHVTANTGALSDITRRGSSPLVAFRSPGQSAVRIGRVHHRTNGKGCPPVRRRAHRIVPPALQGHDAIRERKCRRSMRTSSSRSSSRARFKKQTEDTIGLQREKVPLSPRRLHWTIFRPPDRVLRRLERAAVWPGDGDLGRYQPLMLNTASTG